MDATWVLGGLIGVLLIAWATGEVRHRRVPCIQVTAYVVATRTAVNEGSGWDSPSRFLVTFCDDAGNQRELGVPEALYPRFALDQRGTLTLRGERVINFSVL